jgi:hypothetical protein
MSVQYFAQPCFRKDSPDFAHLRNLPNECTLETPGAFLALAVDYYQIEAYANEADRNAACGPTAHPDVRYFPINEADIGERPADDIGCGYSIDHPKFEEIAEHAFARAIGRLIDRIVQTPHGKTGSIATSDLFIARARYTLVAIAGPAYISFDVHALSAFENIENEVMKRTADYLNNRLMLELSPSMINARLN